MRYSILLLALLLYNAGHGCLATHANSQEAGKITTSTATDSDLKYNSSTPLFHTNNETVKDDDDDDGDGIIVEDIAKGSGSEITVNSSLSSRNDTNRVHVYSGKLDGQQTTNQTSSTSTTYVTRSTTNSISSHAVEKSSLPLKAIATATADARMSETPSSIAPASIKTTALAEDNMQPAFVYKAAVPTHEEESTVAAHSINASSNDTRNGDNDKNDDDVDGSKIHDGASSKKIIGSSVVTSVSVVLNGDEPEFTDAIGMKIPKPQPSLQVASPIDLLNPDRYEFYTFDDNGELVKRLMTMQEIQSIVANGDGEGPTIIHKAPVDERDPEKNVQDIVNSVQTVLSNQADTNKNATTENLPVLDTPDVSSSWSMILPAIFGNTGGDIFLQQKPSQILMEPDTEIIETSTAVTATIRTTKKPKPIKRKPGQKRKTSTTTTTTEMTPQVVQEELGPYESVYTGMEEYQNMASNVQNFEGIPELNLKPLLQQTHNFSTNAETTTKRVFVNNQELIQTADSSPADTEKSDFNEKFSKKPTGVSHRVPPHRNISTKRPQVTHTKQKVKRKPSTTTSTTTSTTSTTAAPETTTSTTSTTAAPETTTSTTSTTAAPETTTSTTTSTPTITTTVAESIIPSTTVSSKPTISTTHKKKKKKPTHQPLTHSTHTIVANDESTIHYTKPHPQRKPATHKPKPSHSPISYKKPTIVHDQAAESTIHHTTTNKINHHKRPRPHKTTTTTSTTTSTTTTTTTPAPSILATSTVAEDNPALLLESYVSPNLLNQLKINDTTVKLTATRKPSPYPIPNYGVNKPPFAISDLILESQLKKEKLPTLSMIQQHYQQSTMTEQPITPMTTDDLPAMLSFDQLMQSLKGDGTKHNIEKLDLELQEMPSTKKPIVPIKYDSAESMDELQEIVNKKKKPITISTKMPEIEKTISTGLSSNQSTTERPQMSYHYESSTLPALFSGDAELHTDHSNITNTSTVINNTEESISIQSEDQSASKVTIKQQYMLSTTTTKPYDVERTELTKPEDLDEETTNTPTYIQLNPVTKQSSPVHYLPTKNVTRNGEENHVVKFEPLYAEDTEPIITDLSTIATPIDIITSVFDQNDESTLSETLEDKTDNQHSTETTESEGIFTTQDLLRLPVTAPQKVADDESVTHISYGIADLKPSLNMDVVNPTDQILMGSFQSHAATVASILVDGANTIPDEPKDELQFLMTDVLKQVADAPAEPNMNRLTNFAQLNSSFLLKPAQNPSSTTPEDISSENIENEQISVHLTTELASTLAANYVEKTENNVHQMITETSTEMESTTHSPERQENIQTEKQFLDEQTSTTEAPAFEYETTTFNIPILSLSKIDSYQQKDTLEMESSTEPSTEIQTTEKGTTYGLNYQTGSTEIHESDHTMHLENQYEQFYQTKPEENDETNISTEEHEKFDESSVTNQPLVEENLNTTLINNDEQYIDTTTETPVSVTLINELPITKPNGSEQSSEKETNIKYSNEENNFESEESAQLSTQYVTESNENDEENKSSNKAQNQSQLVSIEQIIEAPESPNFEQTTFLPTISTETSGEMWDELIATMLDQTGLDPEAVYVKLGESTASPSVENNSNTTKNEITNQTIEKNSDSSNANVTVLETLTPSITKTYQSQETEIKEHTLDLNDTEVKFPQKSEDAESNQQQNSFNSTSTSISTSTSTSTSTTTSRPIVISSTKRLNTLKPVSYYKQPSFGIIYNQPDPPKIYTYSTSSPQQRPMQRPAALSNLMASSTQATRPPVKLDPSPDYSKGLEASIVNMDEDVLAFSKFCNELAFNYWKLITSEKISSARSLVLSPFALTSMLSMVFLGARGGTSGEMNEVLKLDDVVTFNPHLVFKNITDSVERSTDSDIATAAFVREIFSDRSNGKILQFFKDKTQQFYAGHVEEVNFHVVNDIVRRRTNLLVKRHTMGKVLEYLRTNSVWVNGPLATISANLFQTDCSRASTQDRDGEMFFQVHPTVRQRRLVPIPAVLYKIGFTAGYEPNLDATVVAFGRIKDTVSTIYVMPGHQSSVSPTDNLERLQKDLVELAFKENAWSNLLTALMDRPGMEVQLPRFSHRSFVNATLGLQKMGLKGLFKSDFANLRGLTGSSNRDIYLSDMIQINTFSTCGEERISDHHHVEMYPAPPLRKRNKDVDAREDDEYDSSEAVIDFGSLVQEPAIGRGFYDDLLDPKFLELPLPLRPRQARVPDAPRLRFDKPFLYFVRHNPTGMILFMGRFNPRLLP